jgi:anti-sigma B factor antagonist
MTSGQGEKKSEPMDVNVRTIEGVTVVELLGELTGKTAPDAQGRILAEAQTAGKLLLDLSGVPYMSSAGVRVLLMVYRAVSGKGGRAVLVGLSEELESTMSLIGFLDFFAHKGSLEAGIAELTT